VPITEHYDYFHPEEGCRVPSARVFLVPGEGSRGHKILHHVIVLELVLDGVRMVQADNFKKSLDVVYQ
jgi:hypothetical protein